MTTNRWSIDVEIKHSKVGSVKKIVSIMPQWTHIRLECLSALTGPRGRRRRRQGISFTGSYRGIHLSIAVNSIVEWATHNITALLYKEKPFGNFQVHRQPTKNRRGGRIIGSKRMILYRDRSFGCLRKKSCQKEQYGLCEEKALFRMGFTHTLWS